MQKQKTKIVFLDAGTVDYGDLSFKPLEALGIFQAHYATKPHEREERLRQAQIVVTNKCRFDRELFEILPELKGVFVTATGTDIIDSQAAKELGIAVANVPGYSTASVTQFTISYLLALACNTIKYNQISHGGTWSKSPFFVCGTYPIKEVSTKTLGIVGYGAIGQSVARAARALGMEILAARLPGRTYPKKEKVKRLPLDKLMQQADFVTVHVPLTSQTRGLISAERIGKMKKGAFLINAARGGVVDETGLLEALRSGHLAGAASDVLTQEPPPHNHLLLGAPNLILTPHVAWASLEARTRLIHEVAANISDYLKGKKRNRIV